MGKLILTLVGFAFLFSPSEAQACPFPFNEIGSQCLLFDTSESGSYYDMRLYCSRTGEGARLAHIPSGSQLAEIIQFINKYAAVCGLFLGPSICNGCPFPFETIGTQCLLFDTLECGSYYDMRLYCSRQAEGARLARIPSASQLAEIIAFIGKYGLGHSNYWIDASDDDYEGYWKWTDGSNVPMGAPFWRYDCDDALTMRPTHDTNRNCAVLEHESNYLIADTSCLGDIGELKYCPICEIP